MCFQPIQTSTAASFNRLDCGSKHGIGLMLASLLAQLARWTHQANLRQPAFFQHNLFQHDLHQDDSHQGRVFQDSLYESRVRQGESPLDCRHGQGFRHSSYRFLANLAQQAIH